MKMMLIAAVFENVEGRIRFHHVADQQQKTRSTNYCQMIEIISLKKTTIY